MILKFEDKKAINSKLTGGKGSSLSNMIQNGIPVPNGFVITSEVFQKTLENAGLLDNIQKDISKLKPDQTAEIIELSEEVHTKILKVDFPEDVRKQILQTFDGLNLSLVAVRSSATAEDSKSDSWAGELESFMNTDINTLELNIKKCWSSLYSPRAVTYQLERKLFQKKPSVAVVVQDMVQSEIAGIAFTVHPVSQRKDLMLIEAIFGQGEGIVSGQITPDSYLINKEDLTVLRIQTREQSKRLALPKSLKGIDWEVINKEDQMKQKLNYKQIQQLGEYCKRLESLYKHPQDIEWAFRNNSFFITQSRPITTLL